LPDFYSIKKSYLYSTLDDAMKGSLHRIEHAAAEYLQRIQIVFPEFTSHAIDHSLNLIKILDTWLLDSEQKDYLEKHPWESFFIIATAYLHDIGMIEHPKLNIPGDIKTEDEKKSFIRENHHKRSYAFILESWRDLCIDDEFQAELIALCSLGHRQIAINDTRLSEKIPYRSGKSINVQFVSACIRLADELDLTFERTPESIYEMIAQKNDTTILEWCKHFSIGGVAPHSCFPGTIHIRCRCKDLSVHMSLKDHEIKLQTMLNEINRYVKPRFLFSNVFYDINNIGYEPVDYRFIIDTASAFQLFMGENIYDDKRVFLRELIQNSIDACKIKQRQIGDYVPKIEIRTDLGENLISIRDNGAGMDLEWVQKYLLPVGISFYKSEELTRIVGSNDVDLSFIGRFGIGFLTAFMVSRNIIIKTKKENSVGLHIVFDNPHSYLKIRKDENITPGTEVIIHLLEIDNNWERTISYFKYYLHLNLKFCDYEIKLFDNAGKTHLIGKEISGVKANFITSKATPFDYSDLEIILPVMRTKVKGIIGLAKIHRGVYIYQDGIFICNDETIIEEGFKNKIGVNLNLKSTERLKLGLDRNKIIWEKNQKDRLKSSILIGCIDACNIYTDEILSQKEFSEGKEQLIVEVAKFFKEIYLDDINYQKIHAEIKRSLFFLYIDNLISSLTDLNQEYHNKDSIFIT